jgi:hypothetical protein
LAASSSTLLASRSTLFLITARSRATSSRTSSGEIAGLGNDGSRLLDNDSRRTPVLVRMPLIAWSFPIGSYRQIGGHCWRGKS